jgi:DNA-binding FadR family transcriptional regulator
MNATGIHIEELRRCMVSQRAAQTWRQYENVDNRLHRIIAIASGNIVLLSLFDQLNAIRRAIVWGRLREHSDAPPADHHSFSQHEQIINSIGHRDPELASQLMREHLEEVRDNLMYPARLAKKI